MVLVVELVVTARLLRRTKTWLANHMDDVFMFPNIIRFSWGTVEPFSEKAVKVEWPHEKVLDKVRNKCVADEALCLPHVVALGQCSCRHSIHNVVPHHDVHARQAQGCCRTRRFLHAEKHARRE